MCKNVQVSPPDPRENVRCFKESMRFFFLKVGTQISLIIMID